MLLTFQPGDFVTYVDKAGKPHNAIVTHWWGESAHSACNVVFVEPAIPRDPVGSGRDFRCSVPRGPVEGSSVGYWQPVSEPVGATVEPPRLADARAPESRTSVVYNGPVYFGPVYFGEAKPGLTC